MLVKVRQYIHNILTSQSVINKLHDKMVEDGVRFIEVCKENDKLENRIEFLEEKVSSLEKENFALLEARRVTEDSLKFERERSTKQEEIYQKRLGLIIPEGVKVDTSNLQPVQRGQTFRDARPRFQQKYDAHFESQKRHWDEKLKAQEEAGKNKSVEKVS